MNAAEFCPRNPPMHSCRIHKRNSYETMHSSSSQRDSLSRTMGCRCKIVSVSLRPRWQSYDSNLVKRRASTTQCGILWSASWCLTGKDCHRHRGKLLLMQQTETITGGREVGHSSTVVVKCRACHHVSTTECIAKRALRISLVLCIRLPVVLMVNQVEPVRRRYQSAL